MVKKNSAGTAKETTKTRVSRTKKTEAAEAAEAMELMPSESESGAPEAEPVQEKKTRGRKAAAAATTRRRRTTTAENDAEPAQARTTTRRKAAAKESAAEGKPKTTIRRAASKKSADAAKLPSIFFQEESEDSVLMNAETIPTAVTMEVNELLAGNAEVGEAAAQAPAGAEAQAESQEAPEENAFTAEPVKKSPFSSFASLVKDINHTVQEQPGLMGQQAASAAPEPEPEDEPQVQAQAAEPAAEEPAAQPEAAQAPEYACTVQNADTASAAVENPAMAGEAAAAAQPAPHVEHFEYPTQAAAQFVPGMPFIDNTLDEVERQICLHVATDEVHAIHVGDPASFLVQCQYGDGRVESHAIGENIQPAPSQPSEPEFAMQFFRSCRAVVAGDKVSTPLPAEGYWLPTHPIHRSFHFSHRSAYQDQIAHAPDKLLSAPISVTMPSMPAPQPAAAPLVQPQVPVQPQVQPAAQPAAQAPAQPYAQPYEPASSPAEGAAEPAAEAEGGAAPQARHNVLICWVGKVDISAALRHDNINPGPIRMLLEHVPDFDHVLLLTTMNQSVLETLSGWLAPCLFGKTLDIQHTMVPDLSDHTLVCQATVEAVEGVIQHYGLPADGSGITFHLSPGSPVTHAILVLLSTIRYKGIRLMQTRLTGLGKAPDILTISMTDILRGPGVNMTEIPEIEVPVADNAKPAHITSSFIEAESSEEEPDEEDQEAEEEEDFEDKMAVHSRMGHKSSLYKEKAGRGDDVLSRFKASHKGQGAIKAPHGRAAHPAVSLAQPMPAQLTETVPLELDIPVSAQEDNKLRAPAGNIGKPTRVSPAAMQPKEGEPPMISAALGAIYKKMQRVATMNLPILLLGESGTGKSRLACYIHEWSGRSGKYVSLDCAGLTDEMFICELFGHRKSNGQAREGAFRKARSGTLFLENVNLLTPTQQSILLRILDPVGETKINLPARPPFPSCSTRIRIIASADISLAENVRQGSFRTDLFYRLAGISTTLPPVREYSYTERETLLRSFFVALQGKVGQCWNFSGDAWQTLLDEKWPGNLREVNRILQQVCLLSESGATISREDVLQQLRQGRFLYTSSPAAAAPAPAPYMESSYQASAENSISPDVASFGPVIVGDDDELVDSPMLAQSETAAAEKEDFFVLGSGQSLESALEQAKTKKILEAMERAKGNRNEAASLLGMTAGQLNYALHRMRQNESQD